MAGDEVLFERQANIAVITLNRPERHNALTNPMFEMLGEFLDEIEDDASVRAVVLTGTGPSFCSGFDLGGPSSGNGATDAGPPRSSRHDFQHHADLVTRTFWRIWKSRLPFVVAARGRCLAGGLYFTAVCDMMLVAEHTQLGMPELKIGMRPPLFNIFPWMMSYRAAKEFLLTGAVVDGARAVELGLVNRVVPDERLMDEAMELARTLASMPDDVVAVMKQSVNRRWELAGLKTGVEHDIDAFVEDKMHMGPFQAEYRRLVREVGSQAARERMGMAPPRTERATNEGTTL